MITDWKNTISFRAANSSTAVCPIKVGLRNRRHRGGVGERAIERPKLCVQEGPREWTEQRRQDAQVMVGPAIVHIDYNLTRNRGRELHGCCRQREGRQRCEDEVWFPSLSLH